MEKSEIVDQLKKLYMAEEVNEEKKSLVDTDKRLVKEAKIKICDCWNKSDGSRKFIKHVLASFIPSSRVRKILRFRKDQERICKILFIKLGGIEDIAAAHSNFMTERLYLREVASVENRSLNSKEISKLESLILKMPVEIRNGTYGFESSSSSVIISAEAREALSIFVRDCFDMREGELTSFMTHVMKSIVNEKLEEEEKPREYRGEYKMDNFLSDEDKKKLGSIK